MSTIRVNNMTNVGGDGPTYAKGMVIQVVSNASTGVLATTSATLASTNLTATITPKSTTSKILVTVTQMISVYNPSNLQIQPSAGLDRNGTIIWTTNSQAPSFYSSVAGSLSWAHTLSYSYYDSPATTSAVTYTAMGAGVSAYTSRFNANANYNHTPGQITLMEVAA